MAESVDLSVEASILAAEVVEARIKEIEKEFCNGKIT
jgi:hypothetical protein